MNQQRPCTCNRLPPPGEPYSVQWCRVCYLFHTDPRYRQLWGGDPKDLTEGPSWLQKMANFSKAVVQHVATGMQQVSEEVYLQRISICQTCEFFQHNSCLKCGCRITGDMLAKARWQISKCPIGKW